jgi:hypothetical protein
MVIVTTASFTSVPADFRVALTAVLGEKRNEFARSFEIDGVEDAPIHAP